MTTKYLSMILSGFYEDTEVDIGIIYRFDNGAVTTEYYKATNVITLLPGGDKVALMLDDDRLMKVVTVERK